MSENIVLAIGQGVGLLFALGLGILSIWAATPDHRDDP